MQGPFIKRKADKGIGVKGIMVLKSPLFFFFPRTDFSRMVWPLQIHIYSLSFIYTFVGTEAEGQFSQTEHRLEVVKPFIGSLSAYIFLTC